MRDLGIVPKGADGLYLPLSLKDRNNLAYMDKLTEEQKQQVEAAYAKFGADYSKKLMTDFFMARGFADRTVSVLGMEKTMGALALKDNEWKLLNDNFGGVEELSKIFAASQTGSKSEVMKAFRDQGIVPDSPKAKWMLAILAALGLAVAAPIIGVSTVGVAPVAIGAAALGGVALAAGAGTSFDMH